MTFKIIQGDLFDPKHGFDGLAQGVNCQGVMGAGIAVPFRERYPLMFTQYAALCSGSAKHLLPGKVHTYLSTPDEGLPDVYNMFTQFQPGANGDYSYVEHAAFNLRTTTELLLDLSEAVTESELGYSVGLPWIGCGIAGLAKHNVEHILRTQLEDSVIDFVLVEQPAV
jgi:O-acetyl-ADP-ribose deacetylase (regulator of RNase III)